MKGFKPGLFAGLVDVVRHAFRRRQATQFGEPFFLIKEVRGGHEGVPS